MKEDAVCIREFFEPTAHKLFSLVGYKVPQNTMLQKKILEPSGDSISNNVHTKCFVEAKGPRQRCWEPRFGRMPFGCTCWTLELSSHVVENLWSSTTETKSPQEFLLTRVPTIIMDVLNYLPLAL